MTQLLELQQGDTLEAYIASFEDLQYQVTIDNNELGELFFTIQFLRGLKPEIGNVVQSQIPDTVEKAIMLPKIQQQVVDKGKYKWTRPTNQYRHNSTNTRQDNRGNLPNSPLWKERQTRDYLKANGLCFYCREPFDANHIKSCTKRPQQHLNTLAVNELDVVLTEEVIHELEVEDTLASDFCQLSLNALSGTEQGEAMKVRALVRNKVMLILVDSGSSHSFVSQAFFKKVGISAVPMAPQQVRLANGEILITGCPKWSGGVMGILFKLI